MPQAKKPSLSKSKPKAKRWLKEGIKWRSPQGPIVVAAIVAIGIYFVFHALASPALYPFHNDEVDQFTRINNARAAVGKPAYSLSPCLSKVARDNAQYMANNRVTRDPTQSEFNTFCPNWTTNGGNAYGAVQICNADGHDSCSAMAFNAFMNSPTHKANILGSFTYAGVGSYRDSAGGVWISHAFAKCTSGCGGSNTDVRTNISASTPAAGSYVKAGQLLTINVNYNSTRDASLNAPELDAFIPPTTTFYSMASGSGDPRVTSHGTSGGTTQHDYNGSNHAYWKFDYIPGNGATYDHYTFSYVIKVNSGLANGTRICPHSDIHSTGVSNSQNLYQPTQADWMSCYTVQN